MKQFSNQLGQFSIASQLVNARVGDRCLFLQGRQEARPAMTRMFVLAQSISHWNVLMALSISLFGPELLLRSPEL